MISRVQNIRKTPYCSEDSEHERQLKSLWHLLKPGEVLEKRFSKQWKKLGFQGTDPKSDFRGMGILGLQNLLFFAKHYNAKARQILTESEQEYSFAIVGINLTALVCQLLQENYLKNHFYNTVPGEAQIEDFHRVYVIIFCDFHKQWMNDKPGIMNFNLYKDRYCKKLASKLKRTDANLLLC